MVINMGRIDAEIPDDLESQFRMEIIKRFGGKKGDLQRSVEEALRLWIESDVVKELEETATSKVNTPITHDKAVEALRNMGRVALPALSRISHNTNCAVLTRDKALQAINEILQS